MTASKGAACPETRRAGATTTPTPTICQTTSADEDNRTTLATQWGDTPEPAPFVTKRDAALALLTGGGALTRQAGSFLGQLVVDATPLTPKQRDWLVTLLERAQLPALGGDA